MCSMCVFGCMCVCVCFPTHPKCAVHLSHESKEPEITGCRDRPAPHPHPALFCAMAWPHSALLLRREAWLEVRVPLLGRMLWPYEPRGGLQTSAWKAWNTEREQLFPGKRHAENELSAPAHPLLSGLITARDWSSARTCVPCH